MAIRCMSKEKEDNLIEVEVDSHGCIDGIYGCYGRFNTSHKYSCGFKPDNGWYRIADYSLEDIKKFKEKGVSISYSKTCEYLRESVEITKKQERFIESNYDMSVLKGGE